MATENRVTSKEIGELLRLMGWSQAELSRKLGLSESAVCRWFKDEQKPNGAARMMMRQWLDEARSTKPPARKSAAQPA